MEYRPCEFGRKCGKFGEEGCRKRPTPIKEKQPKRLFLELPPHMKSAEPDNKSCGDKTLLDFYEENYKRLEKCRDNKKWICEDDQWKCPNNKYDCNWTGPYAPKRITDMEHCEFGRKCGKFGPGRCYNGIRPPIKQKIQKLEPPPHNAEPDDLDELPIYFEPDSDEIPINFEDDEEEIDEIGRAHV